ncbi:HD domain-containing protein, partial [Streptomyces spectabilis]|uniref:HD domain-containing protein n=1 Tax=Streptomyces spectabilis TaxID=68270 RepID=UPI0033DF1041
LIVLEQAMALEADGPDLRLRLAALLHDIGKPNVHAPATVCLLAPGAGRWDLLVVPHLADDAEGPRLMAAAFTEE